MYQAKRVYKQERVTERAFQEDFNEGNDVVKFLIKGEEVCMGEES